MEVAAAENARLPSTLFDSHCHATDGLEALRASGLRAVCMVSTGEDEWERVAAHARGNAHAAAQTLQVAEEGAQREMSVFGGECTAISLMCRSLCQQLPAHATEASLGEVLRGRVCIRAEIITNLSDSLQPAFCESHPLQEHSTCDYLKTDEIFALCLCAVFYLRRVRVIVPCLRPLSLSVDRDLRRRGRAPLVRARAAPIVGGAPRGAAQHGACMHRRRDRPRPREA
eukprot:6205568-Pleurochrysis_carterae.AAC.4